MSRSGASEVKLREVCGRGRWMRTPTSRTSNARQRQPDEDGMLLGMTKGACHDLFYSHCVHSLATMRLSHSTMDPPLSEGAPCLMSGNGSLIWLLRP